MRRDEAGAVTAETAAVIPLLAVVVIGLCWVLGAGLTQARLVDAARETARAMARGEDRQEAIALGREVAPRGSRFDIDEDGDTVTVTVTAVVEGPGGILGFLRRESSASATAASEGGP